MLCDVFHGGDGLAYGAVIWVTLETGKLQRTVDVERRCKQLDL
jgi:hypothetical protein